MYTLLSSAAIVTHVDFRCDCPTPPTQVPFFALEAGKLASDPALDLNPFIFLTNALAAFGERLLVLPAVLWFGSGCLCIQFCAKPGTLPRQRAGGVAFEGSRGCLGGGLSTRPCSLAFFSKDSVVTMNAAP